MKKILVKKENGKFENFDIGKLKRSLKNSGADEKITKKICKEIEKKVLDGLDTLEIYNITKELLKKYSDTKVFLRYNLPSAISKMGPEGFAFEKFIGEVFEAYAYSPVYVGKKIAGKCIKNHEMDIVAFKNNDHVTAELKFHNSRSKKTDLRVALYMKARFEDIESAGYYGNKKAKQMIVTNTKFTINAKKYARCAGIEVLSWNYPEGKNLHDFILNSGVHPMTALTSISGKAKEYFIKRKIVSCRDLMMNNKQAMKENMYIAKADIADVVEEISQICDFAKSNFNPEVF